MDLLKSELWLRRLVIAYNIFFWVTGPGIVGLGVWVYIALAKHEPVVIRKDFADPSYVIIVAGILSVIAGIVGCLGGVNEHTKLLYLYFFLMFAVCALEVSATVLSFKLYDEMEPKLRSSIDTAMRSYDTSDDSHSALNEIQHQYACCGLQGPMDWFNTTQATIPSSCCPNTETFDFCYPTTLGIFLQGCLKDLKTWTKQMLLIGGWTVFAMACTQLLALAVICCFTRTVSIVFVW